MDLISSIQVILLQFVKHLFDLQQITLLPQLQLQLPISTETWLDFST